MGEKIFGGKKIQYADHRHQTQTNKSFIYTPAI